jgi:hypothetical protein
MGYVNLCLRVTPRLGDDRSRERPIPSSRFRTATSFDMTGRLVVDYSQKFS